MPAPNPTEYDTPPIHQITTLQFKKKLLNPQESEKQLKEVVAPINYQTATQTNPRTHNHETETQTPALKHAETRRQSATAVTDDSRLRATFTHHNLNFTTMEAIVLPSEHATPYKSSIKRMYKATQILQEQTASDDPEERKGFKVEDKNRRKQQANTAASDERKTSEPFKASGQSERQMPEEQTASDDPEERKGFKVEDKNRRKQQANTAASDERKTSEPFKASRQSERQMPEEQTASDDPEERKGFKVEDKNRRKQQANTAATDERKTSEPFKASGQSERQMLEEQTASDDPEERKGFKVEDKNRRKQQANTAASDERKTSEPFKASGQSERQMPEEQTASDDPEERKGFKVEDKNRRKQQANTAASDERKTSEPFKASRQSERQMPEEQTASDDPEERKGFKVEDENRRKQQANTAASDERKTSEPFKASGQSERQMREEQTASDDPEERKGFKVEDKNRRKEQVVAAAKKENSDRKDIFVTSEEDVYRAEGVPTSVDDLLVVREKIDGLPRVKNTMLSFSDNDIMSELRQQSDCELNRSLIDADYVDYNTYYKLVFVGGDVDVEDGYNHLVKDIKYYNCALECMVDLSSGECKRTLVVLCRLFEKEENVARHLKAIASVECIYLLTSEDVDTNKICEYVDICRTKNDVRRLIEDRIRNFYSNTAVFCLLTSATEEGKLPIHYLTKEQADVIWTELLLKQVFTVPDIVFTKEATANYFQCQCGGNLDMRNSVAEFERTYQGTKTALECYTSNAIIRSLVEKVIRTQSVKGLFEIGYFLNDLKNDMNQLKSESLTAPFFWHRSMSIEDLEKIKKNTGGLIIISSFICGTKEPNIKPLSGTSVLFQFECDSAKQYDGQLVIEPGSVFNIKWVHISETDLISCVYLIKNNDYDILKNVEDIADSDSLLTSGKFLIFTNQFEKAKTYYEEIGLRCPSRCFIHSHLAYIYTEIGLRSQGSKHYKIAIEILEGILKSQFDEKEQMETLLHLGELYHTIDENVKAREHLERALEIMSKKLPIDQAAIGTCNSLLGITYDSLGDYNNAREHAERGLYAHLLSLPPKHSLTAISYFNLACIYRHLRDYKLALTCLEKVLEISMNILPLNHRQLAPIFHNFGLTYHETADYEKARQNYKEELNILEHSHPTDSYRIDIIHHLFEELMSRQNASLMFNEQDLHIKNWCTTIVDSEANTSTEDEDKITELLNTRQKRFLPPITHQRRFRRKTSRRFMVKTPTQSIAESLSIGRSILWSRVEPFMFPHKIPGGFTLVWVDRNLDDPDVDKLLEKFHLPIRMREMISYIRGCRNATQTLQYISEAKEEHIFVVLSPLELENKSFMDQLIDQPQVKHVYGFNPDNLLVKFQPHLKLRGIFTEPKALVLKLKSDVDSYDATPDILFNVLNSNQIERSLRNLTQESVTFMWYDLMIDILLRLEKKNALQDMIEFCRLHYSDDKIELEKIDEFQNTYNPNEAALWYTKGCFVYRIVNRALRTQNAATIYNIRSYICDLHNQLVKKHREFIKQLTSEKKEMLNVFRGQKMEDKEFKQCERDALISTNTFFSTSAFFLTACVFADNDECSTLKSVVFDIQIDIKVDAKPYAYLNENVNQESEQEVLFSIGSIFRVESIEENEAAKKELVNLRLTNHENNQIQKMKQHWKIQLNLDKNPLPETAWGSFLCTLGEYTAAEEHLLKLLNSQQLDDEALWYIHSDLGMIYHEKKELEKSIFHYQISIEIEEKHLLFHQISLKDCERCLCPSCRHLLRRRSVLYNNIGGVILNKGDHMAALEYFHSALNIDIATGCDRSHLYEVAKTYNNIGHVHMDKNDDKKALQYFDKADEICASPMVDSGPVDINNSRANIYNNIGLIHKKAGRVIQAKNAFKKSVEFAKKLWPENHPYLTQYIKNLADLEHEHYGDGIWV